MKMQSPGKWMRAALFFCFVAVVVRGDTATNYTVHEWGTFTSVQGGNGELLAWNSLKVSELPAFVYNWKQAGLNRGALFGGKVSLTTLQRLETPVIYFYANQPMTADVDVAFPRGFITEWYPQAAQIGPTFPMSSNAPSDGILRESRAIWRGLEILPGLENDSALKTQLPQDSAGSHYFFARETASSMVRANFSTATNTASEIEKFIFYRGAGSFKTPLRVMVDSNNIVTVENTGPQPLEHLFLVNIHDGRGAYSVLDELSASNSVRWLQMSDVPAEHWNQLPLPDFQAEIGAQVQAALISEGLFPAEAKAMVNTWTDSWFTEDGVRVLYLLPRPWTDEILPMKLTPQPKELTRVMVGRAEVIMPSVETKLFQLLTDAQNGDETARAQARNKLTKLGRFAEPALRLANAHSSRTNIVNLGYQLLNSSPSTFE